MRHESLFDTLTKGFGNAVNDIREKIVEEGFWGRVVNERDGSQGSLLWLGPKRGRRSPKWTTTSTTARRTWTSIDRRKITLSVFHCSPVIEGALLRLAS
jgi:hypothetical protein